VIIEQITATVFGHTVKRERENGLTTVADCLLEIVGHRANLQLLR